MENPTRPNLFTYATSELSQDAFICWLAAWVNSKSPTIILPYKETIEFY
ncbi:hypothetical protein [Spirosoma flavum]|uniref:Uncharacterized protein n=1 Tax=Spirosoma flavum TaxID=2048557 RepID=A0ABW6ACH5_9BACT